jgi:hypothetical protein
MRASRATRTGLVVSAAALALGLAGCGDDGGSDGGSGDGGDGAATQLFPDDFEPVCQGATVSAATAYDEAATTHKALYFASVEEGLTDRSSELPADWTVTFSTDGDALAAIDLVLCAVRTGEELVETCTGYEDDGVDTGNAVNWHTATYEVSVRAATTGQVLAQETMEADDEECPSFVFFGEDGETIDQYASLPEETVVAFLQPFVAP